MLPGSRPRGSEVGTIVDVDPIADSWSLVGEGVTVLVIWYGLKGVGVSDGSYCMVTVWNMVGARLDPSAVRTERGTQEAQKNSNVLAEITRRCIDEDLDSCDGMIAMV